MLVRYKAQMLSPVRLVLIAFAIAAGSVGFAATRPSPRPRVLATQQVPPPRPASATPAAGADPQTLAYTVKSILPIDGPLKMGDHHWDERAAPSAGTIVITVDLAAQVLSVFRDGHEIGAAAILFGADAKPTPLGVYPITQKDADHVSNIYHAPMPYMLRMTNDGISIHASEVADGYMTHGCIGVPKPFAKKLFETVKLGDKVIVTRGEALEVGQAVKAA
jgi:lipoprotein-anchoring transpeptidase ErfK/SrfK